MVTIKVKGGTAEEGVSLCVARGESSARGHRAAEEEVFCRMIEPNARMPLHGTGMLGVF
jgi:hypothetical protein